MNANVMLIELRPYISNMQKTLKSILLTGMLSAMSLTGTAAGLTDSLLPTPQQCEVGNGSFTISDKTAIYVVSDGSAEGEFVGTRLAELIKEQHGVDLKVIQKKSDTEFSLFLGNSDQATAISLDPIKGKEEGYVLNAGKDGASVSANTAQGLFHGAMTLRQLVDDKKVQGCSIVDYPRYELRGFMVDAGRAPVRLENIKRIIRINSAFKLNFMLYRESDNELNAVQYDSNPLGSKNPEALTMPQVKEMIDYAALHGIQVIPEIEGLGHAGARRMHFPELVRGTAAKPYGNDKDGNPLGMHYTRAHLLPSDERSFALLDAVFSEWFKVMDCKYIHLGMDEIRMPKEDQAKHLEKLIPRVLKLAEKYNQSPKFIVWSDAPATPEAYKDIVIRSPWSYGNRNLEGGLSKHLKHQKMESLLDPNSKEKVLMGAGASSGHGPGSKCGYEKSFKNLAEWAILGNERKNFIGITSCQWHDNQLDQWLPDFVLGADVSWNPPTEIAAFDAQMKQVQAKLNAFKDVTSPDPKATTPSAWHGVWVTSNGKWDKLIAPLPTPANKQGEKTKKKKSKKQTK